MFAVKIHILYLFSGLFLQNFLTFEKKKVTEMMSKKLTKSANFLFT